MSMRDKSSQTLEDFKVPVKLKISALWAAMMFCYVYGDYFGLFSPGTLMDMNAGRMGPLGAATPAILVGLSVMLAVPSVMVFLSLVLPPAINRWTNIVLGLVYPAIVILTVRGSPPFYLFLSAVEIALNLTTVWYAWSWPRERSVISVA
jgi:hypothetical protein